MDISTGFNLSKLQSCLSEIRKIFEEGEKTYREKILKHQEEKSVLYGLLENKNDVESTSLKVEVENKVLKAELNLLRLNTSEYKAKLSDLGEKFNLFKIDVSKKQTEWTQFMQDLQKKCSCKLKTSANTIKPITFPAVAENTTYVTSRRTHSSTPIKGSHGFSSSLVKDFSMSKMNNISNFSLRYRKPSLIKETESNISIDDCDEGLGSQQLFGDPETESTLDLPKYLMSSIPKQTTNTSSVSTQPPASQLMACIIEDESFETSGALFGDDSNTSFLFS